MADVSTGNKCVFTWKIKNFLSCHTAHDDKVVSPTFEVDNLPVKYWELWLHPKGNSQLEFSQDKIIVFLMRKRPDECSESIVLDITMELLNVDGCAFSSEAEKNYEMKQSGHFGRHFHTIKEFSQLIRSWEEDTLTIRCTINNIINEEEDKVLCQELDAITTINVNQFIFKWDVSNTGCFDWSERVSVLNSTLPNLKVTLSVAPDEAVKINIQLLNDYLQNELVMLRMKFLSVSGIQLASMCEMHLFESTDSCVFPTFISIKDLHFGNSSPPCYKYTFIFECIVSKKSISSSKIAKRTITFFVKKESTILAGIPSLQHDFRELFINKKYSDVKLRVNSVDILAHKTVLATRSPVFSAMFDQDMLENHTGVVQIKDMTEKTLQDLLEFMYTDIVSEMDLESALNLLLAADKYQVLNLRDRCSSVIMSLLSEENVCIVILVADMISHETLKTFALNFILANASKVFSTPNWCLWVKKNVQLAAEIICKFSEYHASGVK